MKRIIAILTFIILGGNLITAQNVTTEITETEADTSFFDYDTLYTKPLYDWVTYQMKVTLENPKEKLLFQCYFVNRIDSIIYLNLNKSGIELARLVLTPDSVTYINKLQHEYYQGGYELFNKVLGFSITFDMIQSLMNATDFSTFVHNFKRVDEDSQRFYISPMRASHDGALTLMQTIEVAPDGRIVKNEMTDLKSMRDFNILYLNYAEQGGFALFQRMSIEMETDETKLEAEIKNVKFNQPGPTRIKIPSSFTEMDLQY